MAAFLSRNLKVFFRDKASVFFSLLAVLIIIGLYVVFLGDVMVSGMEGQEGMKFLVNSWMVGGILSVVSMTTTLGAFGVMVEDKARKLYKDFYVTPLKRNAIAGGYVLSALCVGVIMSMVVLVIGEGVIVAGGGELLPPGQMLKVIGGILLAVLSSGAIVFFVVSFFNSLNAYTAISTVIGTMIGFLTGMYIPVGSLPEGVQNVVKVFPVSYSASYFRTLFTERPMEIVFKGAPASMATDFKTEMGVNYTFDDKTTTLAVCIIVMVFTAAVFYSLAMMNLSRKRR